MWNVLKVNKIPLLGAANTAQKSKFSIKDFLMEEILNGKLHFLCSVSVGICCSCVTDLNFFKKRKTMNTATKGKN